MNRLALTMTNLKFIPIQGVNPYIHVNGITNRTEKVVKPVYQRTVAYARKISSQAGDAFVSKDGTIKTAISESPKRVKTNSTRVAREYKPAMAEYFDNDSSNLYDEMVQEIEKADALKAEQKAKTTLTEAEWKEYADNYAKENEQDYFADLEDEYRYVHAKYLEDRQWYQKYESEYLEKLYAQKTKDYFDGI